MVMEKKPLHIRVAEHLDERKEHIDDIGYNAHYEMGRLSNALKKKEDVAALKRAAELLAKPLGDSELHTPSTFYAEHNLASGRLLAELASHKDAGVRKSAVDAISNYLPLYRDSRLVDAVNRALKDDDKNVRQSALNAKKIMDEHKEVWKDLDEMKGPLNRLADALLENGLPISEGFAQNDDAQKIIINYGGKKYLPDGFSNTIHTIPMLRLMEMATPLEKFMGTLFEGGGVALLDPQQVGHMRISPILDTPTSRGLLGGNPKLVSDAAAIAKKIVDMRLRNKIEDTPISNHAMNAVSLLSLLAVHYNSKEALGTLTGLVGREGDLSTESKEGERDKAKQALRSFFSMVGLYAKERGMSEADELLGKLSKQEIEEGKKLLKRQKEIEQKVKEYQDAIDRLAPLTNEELDRLVKAGDDGIREIIDGYNDRTRTIDDVFTVLRKSGSPLATDALLNVYDQSRRQETEKLLEDMDKPLEERMKGHKEKEEGELLTALASILTGTAPPERRTTRKSIAQMLVEKGTPKALEPLLDEIDLDEVSYKALLGIAPEKAGPLKGLLDKKGVPDAAKARALYILGRKQNPEINDFIYDRFKAAKSPIIKQAATLALYGAGDPRALECAKEMLGSPDQKLDKSVLTLTGTASLNSKAHHLRREDINTNHRFAAEIISAISASRTFDSELRFSGYLFGNHAEAEEIAKKLAKSHPDKVVRKISSASSIFLKQQKGITKAEQKPGPNSESTNKMVESLVDDWLKPKNYPLVGVDWHTRAYEAYNGLGHRLVSHTSHQYAAYLLGINALDGNKLALKHLRNIRNYTNDEHAIKVADMVVKHLEKEGKKK